MEKEAVTLKKKVPVVKGTMKKSRLDKVEDISEKWTEPGVDASKTRTHRQLQDRVHLQNTESFNSS